MSVSHGGDPRGYDVIGADMKVAGKVVDLWVDRSEALIRYFEVKLAGGRHVLLPMNLLRHQGRRRQDRASAASMSTRCWRISSPTCRRRARPIP